MNKQRVWNDVPAFITMGDLGNHIACPFCPEKDRRIKELEKKLALTEKALELACRKIIGSCEYCSYATMPECPTIADCIEEKTKYFKQQAQKEYENV